LDAIQGGHDLAGAHRGADETGACAARDVNYVVPGVHGIRSFIGFAARFNGDQPQ